MMRMDRFRVICSCECDSGEIRLIPIYWNNFTNGRSLRVDAGNKRDGRAIINFPEPVQLNLCRTTERPTPSCRLSLPSFFFVRLTLLLSSTFPFSFFLILRAIVSSFESLLTALEMELLVAMTVRFNRELTGWVCVNCLLARINQRRAPRRNPRSLEF